MASEKSAPIHDKSTPKRSKRQRVRSCCARWWWLFILIFICLLLVVVLPVIYVGYPKAARKSINESELKVTSMSITNPTPTSVDMAFNQVFYSNSSYHPTLYPFNGSFYLVDNKYNTAFATIQTPKLKASNGSQSTVAAQRVDLESWQLNEFNRYVLLALSSEEFTIALRGRGDLKEGVLPRTGVFYDKNVTMKGFNSLKGFALNSFHVLNETEADGTNARGTASIPNPSVMTIELGNVTFSMSVNGTAVGTSAIDNLVLKPGNNVVDMRAEVYQLVVVGIVLKRANAVLPVDIKGNTSTYNGEQISYYNNMLAATSLQVELNVTEATSGDSPSVRRSLALLE